LDYNATFIVGVKPGYSFGYVSKSLSTVPPGTPGAYVYVSIQYLVIAI